MNKNNKFLFWITAGLVLVLGLYAGARAVLTFSGLTEASNLKQVILSPAPKNIGQDKIMGAIMVSNNSPIYDYNLKDMAANLMRIPEVSNAVVKRQPGGKLFIMIGEKAFVAVWTDGKSHYPMTADGDIIDKPLSRVPQGELIFSGDKPADVIAAVNAFNKFPDLRRYFKMVHFVEGRRFDITTINGAKIMLPEGDLGAAMARIAKLGIINKKGVFDLRDANRTLVK
ncbi:MAG: FtsQ-type POTRA domain-containing protein [Rickettsiales bacterium]|jgi:cell division septal protein FtsQ|nr:FtsQ-type POTRA domain-containing protein [Rickettsiales bacterium]